ncbi:hypothetical protein DASC09_042970 [Saccharomycopsis crataegensis]|uniref:GTP cyclohydrolase II n=1 Tax=Saccharomycopsis crataegensis TaxID=43959 RepID=A0AAV5QQ37_9ASCO|nr:hypothetical protein DASC09_042970 [Saccharomycopsis crataegensis]
MAPAAVCNNTNCLHGSAESRQTPIFKDQLSLDDQFAKLVSGIPLTTYYNDPSVSPIPVSWGAATPTSRGPIVASRAGKGVKKHNTIGSYGGCYNIYHALAVASHQLNPEYRADYTNAEPAYHFKPQPQWFNKEKIVALDPLGHLAPWEYGHIAESEEVEIKPTISITKAHLQLLEMEDYVKKGELEVDGEVVVNQAGDLAVTKLAVDPVWYLPGVAKRFGISEIELRRALFNDTCGMYPELLTRPDIKTFLPPIGGLTVYIFGNPENISDSSKKLALRVHDSCGGSDVFGSDICTCRPYLMFGIREAVKEAQAGGAGAVVYFQKEGRALGEVTKYLVYNARKRGGDSAAEYFKRTECIAGVRDMRFQQLMPDILHWLGITKIDRMLSMSNMKYDAIVESGIQIVERVPIPEDMIPADGQVEIDAKIQAGYFTTGNQITEEELKSTMGRSYTELK